jgi:hypothetical protein
MLGPHLQGRVGRRRRPVARRRTLHWVAGGAKLRRAQEHRARQRPRSPRRLPGGSGCCATGGSARGARVAAKGRYLDTAIGVDNVSLAVVIAHEKARSSRHHGRTRRRPHAHCAHRYRFLAVHTPTVDHLAQQGRLEDVMAIRAIFDTTDGCTVLARLGGV